MRTEPSPSVTDTPLPTTAKSVTGWATMVTPSAAALARELADEAGVLDHVGERLARLDVALEAQEHRPYRVLDAAVGDDHVADLLRPRRDRVPHAERLEHAPRRRRDRRGARIVAAPELGIGDRHGKIRPERLA